jgi:hypothetical protein
MRRFGMIALLLGLVMPLAAQAQECRGIDAAQMAAAVPYLSTGMRRVPGPDGVLSFVHVDDERLRLSMAVVPGEVPDPNLQRSEYLAGKRRSVEASLPAQPPGSEILATARFQDPISWTVQVRSPFGDDMVSRGVVTTKLRPSCDMILRWDVVETPLLIGRIRDMTAAIDTLRGAPGVQVAPPVFAPENATPTGMRSFVLGVVFPLVAAFGFGYVFRSMARGALPHPRLRLAAACASAAAAGAAVVQFPVYQAHLADIRYTDNATLLVACALSLALFAATGMRWIALGAFAMSLSAGITLGVWAYLGWAPQLEVTVGLSLILTAIGGFGTWAWSAFPARSPRRQVRNNAWARAA